MRFYEFLEKINFPKKCFLKTAKVRIKLHFDTGLLFGFLGGHFKTVTDIFLVFLFTSKFTNFKLSERSPPTLEIYATFIKSL